MSANKNNRINLSELFLTPKDAESSQQAAGHFSQETPRENPRGVEMLQQEAERRKNEAIQRQMDAEKQEALMRQQEASRLDGALKQQEVERQLAVSKFEAEMRETVRQEREFSPEAAYKRELEARQQTNKQADTEWHKQEAANYQQETFKRQRYSLKKLQEEQAAKSGRSRFPKTASRGFLTLVMLLLVGSVMAFLAYKYKFGSGKGDSGQQIAAGVPSVNKESDSKSKKKPSIAKNNSRKDNGNYPYNTGAASSKNNVIPVGVQEDTTTGIEENGTKSYAGPDRPTKNTEPEVKQNEIAAVSNREELNDNGDQANASKKIVPQAASTSSNVGKEEAVKKLQYVVKSKAYIYNHPNASGRTSKVLVPAKSMTPFNGLSEENGYVYVSVSQGGDNYKGWVKKQSLKPVTTVFYGGREKD